MIGYLWWLRRHRRRLRRVAVVLAGSFSMIAAAALMIAVITAPAAAPVIVAGSVLGNVAAVFGDDGGEMTGEEMARTAADSPLRCDAAPRADTEEPPTRTTPTAATAMLEDDDADPETVGVEPILLGDGGSISRGDAELLLAPLSKGTSSLRAHVWFLYRLSGMGDWAQFTNVYAAAGLSPGEDSTNAPLRQVQQLNTSGADVERYRLTAAALVEAGQRSGRFENPYPSYRELVSSELLSSCLSDSGVGDRMTLPAPATPTPIG